MVDNRHAYKKENVIKIYIGQPKLFKAEGILMEKYHEKLKNSVFLDIGVGGGRTTYFVAPVVNKYYGVDYSSNFVSHVSGKFEHNENTVIEFGDARDLHQFPNNHFDFILFSFNGIDCVSFEDRGKIVNECFRLLKPGGNLWFSFHNINAITKLYSFQWPKNPLNWIKEWERTRKIKKFNGDISQYAEADYCLLRDGAELFEAEVLYIKPSLQAHLLEQQGFSNIHFYNAQTGSELTGNLVNSANVDWIYVDCIKP
jgi:ubiquinone/menaquinone biosynthesis C-methylase UbiE